MVDGDFLGVGVVLGFYDFIFKEIGIFCVFKVIRGDYLDLMVLVVENLIKVEVKIEY